MKFKTLSVFFICLSVQLNAQESSTWTDKDRAYLLENLKRSKDELIKETTGLSNAQWSFKESPDRWSISEVVEHINYWELIMDNDISRAQRGEAKPELSSTAGKDSDYLGFIMEEKPHHSLEYTKPFSYTIPRGRNELKSNLDWFLQMRNEMIDYIGTTKDNLRDHFLFANGGSTHQTIITLFGHTDRHLRQVKKVKQHPRYPKG